MIAKAVFDITYADIQALIDNGVIESKTLEYKRELPGRNDEEKREFLADVSAFANSSGGDIVYGIEQREGMPVSIVANANVNQDAETARLESILRDGLDPRIPLVEFKPISVGKDGWVLLVRIRRSWLAPHRVVFRGHDRFYGRSAAGKFPLDVRELRTAFLAAQTVSERIRSFRADRIARILSNETPIPLRSGTKLVLHVFAVNAFAADEPMSIVGRLEWLKTAMPLMSTGGYSWCVNLDGLCKFSGDESKGSNAYVQFFRTGVIESVVTFRADPGEHRRIYDRYEDYVIKALPAYLPLLMKLDLLPPYAVGVAFVDARNCQFVLRQGWSSDGVHTIDMDALVMPSAIVDDISADFTQVMRPTFDLVWNAFNFERAFSYDDNGVWH